MKSFYSQIFVSCIFFFSFRSYNLISAFSLRRHIYIFYLPPQLAVDLLYAALTGRRSMLPAQTLPTRTDPTPHCSTKVSWQRTAWWELRGILLPLCMWKQSLVFNLWDSYRFMQTIAQDAILSSRVQCLYSFCTGKKQNLSLQNKEQQFSIYYHFEK